ncbi:MAG: hypothetical protein JOY58_07790, partial [Solirubrobacterales bacterium]|nr:hypothetical protein [Solirubrobacterales bacterium]
RGRFGYRTWRAVHWTAYASWPVALLHGLGTGSDTKTGWMLVLTGVCVIAVIVAVVARATAGWPDHAGARMTALAASVLTPIGLLVWLPGGPLAAGWAKEAGTPASLLAAAGYGAGSSSASPPPAFSAQVSGGVRQSEDPSGLEKVDLSLLVAGQRLNRLDIQIFGQPIGGGVQMTGSAVTLGTASDPDLYQGRVVGLDGTNVQARLRGPTGNEVLLAAELQIDQGSGAASGTVTSR